jgi:hypothetical protein
VQAIQSGALIVPHAQGAGRVASAGGGGIGSGGKIGMSSLSPPGTRLLPSELPCPASYPPVPLRRRVPQPQNAPSARQSSAAPEWIGDVRIAHRPVISLAMDSAAGESASGNYGRINDVFVDPHTIPRDRVLRHLNACVHLAERCREGEQGHNVSCAAGRRHGV